MKRGCSWLFGALLVLLSVAGPTRVAKASVFRWSDNRLVLDNKTVVRTIVYDARRHAFTTSEIKLPDGNFNFVGRRSEEFGFEVDGRPCFGSAGWEMKAVEPLTAAHQGEGATAVLRSVAPNPDGLELGIEYVLYPRLPVIRKRLVLRNASHREMKIESLDVERLRAPERVRDKYYIYTNYARRPRVGMYTGDCYDSVVAVHDVSRGNGLALGNEAPGFVKRTTAFLDGHHLTIGLTHKDQLQPFRKWLKPGETWESTWTFVCPYEAREPQRAMEGPVADYVRRHMGLRAAEIQGKPQFIFNTWYPQMDKISEASVLAQAEVAAQCGARDFHIDAGWHRNEGGRRNEPWWSALGDYQVDTNKFPRGLTPVFDRVRELGMRPGLWMSLATVSKNSRVYHEHPEWMIRDRQGQPAYLHNSPHAYWSMCTACLTTGWYDHVKAAMFKQIRENRLKYVKIDLAYVTGVYWFDEAATGCYATNHPHKDRQESLLMIYRRAEQLFDELHEAFPDLYVDCTYEATGEWHLMDLAMCKHAAGNWLTNYPDPPPTGTLRLRNFAWWACGTIPAAVVIEGHLRVEDEPVELTVMSLAGTTPVLCGDPCALAPAKRARLRQWSDWLARAQELHKYELFRQDLAEVGEPREGAWDGWQRINTETQSGGIVGVFRQGSRDSRRTVYVARLRPDRVYSIHRAPDGHKIAELTGKRLEEEGLPVDLEKPYDGAVFEVRSQTP